MTIERKRPPGGGGRLDSRCLGRAAHPVRDYTSQHGYSGDVGHVQSVPQKEPETHQGKQAAMDRLAKAISNTRPKLTLKKKGGSSRDQ